MYTKRRGIHKKYFLKNFLILFIYCTEIMSAWVTWFLHILLLFFTALTLFLHLAVNKSLFLLFHSKTWKGSNFIWAARTTIKFLAELLIRFGHANYYVNNRPAADNLQKKVIFSHENMTSAEFKKISPRTKCKTFF